MADLIGPDQAPVLDAVLVAYCPTCPDEPMLDWLDPWPGRWRCPDCLSTWAADGSDGQPWEPGGGGWP